MYLGDLDNAHGNPRLHRPAFTIKNFGQPCIYSVKLRRCNVGVPMLIFGIPRVQ